MASYGDDSEERPGPGNEKFPGQDGDVSPAQGSGGDEAGGGKRRRRRRGGRRHRRRRERENEMRQQAGLEGLPQGDELDGDYDDAPAAPSASDGVMSDAERDRHQDDGAAPADEAAATAPMNEPERTEESVAEVEIPSDLDAERETDEAAEEEPAPPAKKKRTSRAKASPSKATKSAKPKAPKSATPRRATAKRTPPKKAADKDRADGKPSAKASLASVVETPVVKTGSADKHLVDDDPVEGTSPRRASRRYDLDEIPDDYD